VPAPPTATSLNGSALPALNAGPPSGALTAAPGNLCGCTCPPLLPPGAHTHDGLFLRFQVGAASASISAHALGNEAGYQGGGGSIAGALDWAVSSHVVVYGEGIVVGAAGPVGVNLNGMSTAQSVPETNIYGYGGGASYYFGSNVFVGAALLLATVELDDANGNARDGSKTGLAVDFNLGKEWWVSNNWALGLNGRAVLGAMSGKEVNTILDAVPSWTASAFSLEFSATYN
jgi:hypothetical protein